MKQSLTSRKVNQVAREVFAELLYTEVADPRLTMLTVSRVEVTKDRTVADIYIATDPSRYDEVSEGLASAKGRLRCLLGHELGWRNTPELRFHIDIGVDHAMAINEALKKVPDTLESEGAPDTLEPEGAPDTLVPEGVPSNDPEDYIHIEER